MVARTRPHVLLTEGRYEVKPGGPDDGDWHSFPSGHTADAVAAARALVRVFPASTGLAYGAAAAISAVQIPRGKHYPLDVLTGAAIGVLSESLVDRASRWLSNPARVSSQAE
jgi:membrane-associated phospholipid phosphatase